ncbi:MAG: phosphoglucosamine mutase [Chloroflexi bacterium]|nr:MAG: phosphoglucosamine mutase [Chloroflexota bacterium]
MAAVRFGTDGIRGVAGASLTSEIAYALGAALAAHYPAGNILIGRDTRPSGPGLSAALAAGIRSGGATPINLGVIPTPGLAAVVAADAEVACGVVVTASHNPAEYNGLKVIGRDGRKVPDALERELERMIDERLAAASADGASADSASAKDARDDARGAAYAARYAAQLALVAAAATPNRAAAGIRVVLDASNGAGTPFAEAALSATGATVDGMAMGEGLINDGVGATSPAALGRRVVELGADLGIALDGDADRCAVVDERGVLIDGDVVIGLIALDRKRRALPGSERVVATILTNSGVERQLRDAGITLQRTPVGDRHIAEVLTPGRPGFGGEKSGHLLFPEHAPTGDGLISAIELIALLVRSGGPLSALAATLPLDPQVQREISVREGEAEWLLSNPRMSSAIRDAERQLTAGGGRLVVRASGTEPLLRVMGEGPDETLVTSVVDAILAAGSALLAERR